LPSSYYDVIVLGADLAPLLSAALLARRGFRVLVLGHEYLSPTYPVADGHFAINPFNFIGANSPVSRRIYTELGLQQRFRGNANRPSHSFQLVLPGHRLDIGPNPSALAKEIAREFPTLKRPLEEFHQEISQLSEHIDDAIRRAMVWPPDSFWEKREFTRSISALPFDRTGGGRDLLAECAIDHPFRLAARIPSFFGSSTDPDQLSAFCTARLYGNWCRGAIVPEGGFSSLRDVLLDKIRSHSGIVRLDERVREVLTQRGVACGVKLDASSEEIGCHSVVSGVDLSNVIRLVADRAPFEELFERTGEPQVRYYRYTLNLLAKTKGVPAGMGRDLFYLRRVRQPLDAEDILHLQHEPVDAERTLICAEALLPRRKLEELPGYLDHMRESLLESLGEFAPFLADHLIALDSPHDGRPPDIRGGLAKAKTEPSVRYHYRRGPDTMRTLFYFPVLSGLGACGLPIRTPIQRLFLCNHQVVPGLGLEGLMLAAWSTAQVVVRSDRSKKWLFSGLWTKVEI
jgi:phytoene dehydrogenase-like protein